MVVKRDEDARKSEEEKRKVKIFLTKTYKNTKNIKEKKSRTTKTKPNNFYIFRDSEWRRKR